jgi:hypothetical protein
MTEIISRKARWGVLCSVVLLAAAAASFVTARIVHAAASASDRDRVFELNIYRVSPGKARALELRFGDASNLLSRHGLNVLGYWVPDGDPAWNDTFIYLVAHGSRAEADRNWNAFHEDPAFQKFVKAEDAEHLIQKVDTVYMRASPYSRLR